MSKEPSVRTVSELPRLAARAPDSHKGTFGRVLVLAGSRGMSGAAALTGTAALRGGAGLVRVATAQGVSAAVAGHEPSYLTWPLPEDADGMIGTAALPELLELAQANDVLAVGPGLGQSPAVCQVVRTLIASARKPVVLDADGIFAIRDQLGEIAPPLVLTPHPGEFARLVGATTAAVQADRTAAAVRFARDYRVVLVLKGHHTVVSDGDAVYVNQTGNPGMATGGSGDVLTGVVAALLAQGMRSFDAAVLGVFVHGRAGDLAARELGELSLIASDLLRYLPAAFSSVARP
jgi:ADP-dependent NAD(P)H-hydrate dehydratase